jgi:hypothetical protein
MDDDDDATDEHDTGAIDKTSPVVTTYEEPRRPWISGVPEELSAPTDVLAIEPLPEPAGELPPPGQEAESVAVEGAVPAESGAAGDVASFELADVGLSVPVAWVLLQAELARDADSGGQLLRLHVTPMGGGDLATRFDGEVSIMLRDPMVSGPEGRLARWDFDPDAVSAAWSKTGPDDVLSFSLPLEEPLTPDMPVALWVRLSPLDEAQEKILDHLTLRLDGSRRRSSPSHLEGGKWAVASPGQPALLNGPRPRITSAWRTAEAAPPATR